MNTNIAKYIDHTLLKADAKKNEIENLCAEARMYSFASVCVNPTWVKTAADALEGSTVKVCTVIGFPLGATTTEVKAFETENAIQNGAEEIDMVINMGALQDGNDELVKQDISAVVNAAKGKAIVKVIIETSLLTDAEKRTACELAVVSGADFVKTSTGFSTGGATEEDVKLMRAIVGPVMGVKASGGVRSLEDVHNMLSSGATRIGASSGAQIMKGLTSESDY
ncbi:deoxyribose-phosphate aldolase [Sporosarcina sp. FA9]|uniref:deoxyribose-phosphate aldolase n=1 Tax=Sporosarcina sp. FA9 TaxID=3413030 RepID=UPI003F657872